MKNRLWWSVFLSLFLLAACTAHQPIATQTGDLPGFWLGLWHGMISPLTLVFHIFDPSIHVYAFPNSGGWYEFGFLWGCGSSVTGGSSYRSR